MFCFAIIFYNKIVCFCDNAVVNVKNPNTVQSRYYIPKI